MKNLYYISIILIISFFSCKKLDIARINKITTNSVLVTNTSVTAKGTIIDIDKDGITKYGHCWATNSTPTINDFKTEFDNADAGKEFTSTLTQLSANTTYYVCSYASNSKQTIYGEIKEFKISSFSSVSIVTNQLQILSETTFSVNASITNLGSLSALDYGHCWSPHTAPTVNDYKTSNGITLSDINYPSTATGLNLETNYYVRAYVKLDNNSIIYSNELSVLIPDLSVSTNSFVISGGNATLQGTIINLGVLPVIDHGHCWSTTTSNPNFNDNVISKGATLSTGPFYTNLNGLVSGTVYYYRAYARKGTTLKYGVVKSFTY